LISKQYSEINTEIEVEIRNKLVKGKIVEIPFYRNV
jgi:glycine cleavage system aminomethyltransferase T